MPIMEIRPYEDKDFDAVLDLIVTAFQWTHESFNEILGNEIFARVYPDWRAGYREYLTEIVVKERETLTIAEIEGVIVGFLIYFLNLEKRTGELGLNAVHPDYQNRGIGPELYRHAMARMKEKGIEVVEVATGGDASHERARRAYEKCGFTALPLVRYYKKI